MDKDKPKTKTTRIKLPDEALSPSVWPLWVSKHIPRDSEAVIVEGKLVEDVTPFVQALRADPNCPRGVAPLIWVIDGVDELSLLEAIDKGIDAIQSTKSTHQELELNAARLRRRHRRLEKASIARETAIHQREEFLNVCAHDLRSPLGLVDSALSMLLQSDRKKGLNEFTIEMLTRSQRQAKHALTLVNDLLDVMSYEKGLNPEYGLLSLGPFLSEFHKDHLLQADNKGVKFHYENPIPSWNVLADPERVHQLLQNLFSNALKFSEKGKNIYLSVEPFQGRRRTDPKYPMVIINIKDEGAGIPKEKLEKIFDKFTQIKGSHRSEGRGLGLSVAKQISKLHEGNVWAESKEGKGSTFHVLLPHVISQNSQSAAVSTGKMPEIKRVLVAEASENRRKEFFDPLSAWGYELDYVSDGASLVAQSFYSRPDLILIGDDLPKMSAAEVANLLKSNASTSHIPIVLATTKATQKDLLVDRVASVPFSRETFYSTIKVIQQKNAQG